MAEGRRVRVTAARISRMPAEKLARLLEPALPVEWTKRDGAAALKHQLGAGLLPDLGAAPGTDVGFLRPLVQGLPQGTTFQKLLTMRRPPVELLAALKGFATHARGAADSPLQGDPGTLLYYAAIAAALVKCGQRITTLTDEELREGLAWSLEQAAPRVLVKLYRQALA